jgi:hypothetical protein
VRCDDVFVMSGPPASHFSKERRPCSWHVCQPLDPSVLLGRRADFRTTLRPRRGRLWMLAARNPGHQEHSAARQPIRIDLAVWRKRRLMLTCALRT